MKKGPAPGTRQIKKEALASAATLLLYEIAKRGGELKPNQAAEVLTSVIRRYLHQARYGVHVCQIVPETKALVDMAIGDRLRFKDLGARKNWRGRMNTARRLMANPAASWQIDTSDPGWVAITRLPDGSAPRKWRPPSLKAQLLAGMQVHQQMTVNWPRLDSNWVQSARRVLQDPEARWSSRTTNHGLRITRRA